MRHTFVTPFYGKFFIGNAYLSFNHKKELTCRL